jgi:hypothetical protein
MPGMHLKHYAPGTPFIVTDSVKQQLDLMNYAKVGLLLFSHTIDHPSVKHIEIFTQWEYEKKLPVICMQRCTAWINRV